MVLPEVVLQCQLVESTNLGSETPLIFSHPLYSLLELSLEVSGQESQQIHSRILGTANRSSWLGTDVVASSHPLGSVFACVYLG